MRQTKYYLNQEQKELIKNIFETDSTSENTIFYKDTNYMNDFRKDLRYLKIKDVFESGRYGLTKSQRNYILSSIDMIIFFSPKDRYLKILQEIEIVLRSDD